MSNKVKPFYIKRTLDTSNEDVMRIFDKCVHMGANAYDGIDRTPSPHYYVHKVNKSQRYEYFGVDADGDTYFANNVEYFKEGRAVEITVDQVDKHLGLNVRDASKHHPHRDLMISYANDCTQIVEFYNGIEWVEAVEPCWTPEIEYRLVKKVTMSEIKAHFGENIRIVEE